MPMKIGIVTYSVAFVFSRASGSNKASTFQAEAGNHRDGAAHRRCESIVSFKPFAAQCLSLQGVLP